MSDTALTPGHYLLHRDKRHKPVPVEIVVICPVSEHPDYVASATPRQMETYTRAGWLAIEFKTAGSDAVVLWSVLSEHITAVAK